MLSRSFDLPFFIFKQVILNFADVKEMRSRNKWLSKEGVKQKKRVGRENHKSYYTPWDWKKKVP